jgi:hypothetical protein
MRRITLRKLLISMTVIAALLIGFAPRAAGATITGTATGTFVNTNYHQTLIGHEGGDTLYYVTFTNPYSGDITGSAFESFIERVHSNGSTTVQLANETCDHCTVAGRTGGYTAVWNYIGSTTGKGSFIFTAGFGGLKGLVGGGSYDQTTASSGTYSYSYYLP